jgi:DNA adenine methylase
MAGEASDELNLALATIYLNRTNRSGIIKSGGIIGGQQQNGPYKMDCRFNVDGLSDRIRRISKHADRITFSSSDALDFMAQMDTSLPKRSFLYIDPPYYAKGADLYTSFYRDEDHRDLADAILKMGRPWLLTYDNVDPIRKLYARRRQFEIELQYSVQTKRRSTELAVVSSRLRVPDGWQPGRAGGQR